MKLALIAEYDPEFAPHVQTAAAVEHSASVLDLDVSAQWISTADLGEGDLLEYDAMWIAPGSPYRSMRNTLAAIRFAREHDVPVLGTCGGFQHMVIEFARHVAGVAAAQHVEYDPHASHLIITRLACSLYGREMEIVLRPGSKTAQAYGAEVVTERYYCNFAVNPEYVETLESAGLSFVGTDTEGECRVLELAQHRFFVGTLFVPQARSQPGKPHPLVNALLLAAEQHHQAPLHPAQRPAAKLGA